MLRCETVSRPRVTERRYNTANRPRFTPGFYRGSVRDLPAILRLGEADGQGLDGGRWHDTQEGCSPSAEGETGEGRWVVDLQGAGK